MATSKQSKRLARKAGLVRKQKWQADKIAAGLCCQCGAEPLATGRSSRYGQSCLPKRAAWQRGYYGRQKKSAVASN